MTQYNHFETTRADGVYVTFSRIEEFDDSVLPSDYDCYDNERGAAWGCGEWCFIGVHAKAIVLVVEGGVGTLYTLISAGVWAIESDDSEAITDTFREECESMKRHIALFGNATFSE